MDHDIVTIHLPNNESFEVKLDLKGTNQVTDEELDQFRNLLSDATNIELPVKPNNNSLMKERRLILWGNTLKNCYVTVNRY